MEFTINLSEIKYHGNGGGKEFAFFETSDPTHKDNNIESALVKISFKEDVNSPFGNYALKFTKTED